MKCLIRFWVLRQWHLCRFHISSNFYFVRFAQDMCVCSLFPSLFQSSYSAHLNRWICRFELIQMETYEFNECNWHNRRVDTNIVLRDIFSAFTFYAALQSNYAKKKFKTLNKPQCLSLFSPYLWIISLHNMVKDHFYSQMVDLNFLSFNDFLRNELRWNVRFCHTCFTSSFFHFWS